MENTGRHVCQRPADFCAKCTKTQGRPLGFTLRPALLSARGAHPQRPPIQDGTGHWDGVDRLDPSRAFRSEGKQE